MHGSRSSCITRSKRGERARTRPWIAGAIRGSRSSSAFIDGVAVADCDAKFLPSIKNRDDEAQEVWKEAAGDEGRTEEVGEVESLEVVMRHGRDERRAQRRTDGEREREREREGGRKKISGSGT